MKLGTGQIDYLHAGPGGQKLSEAFAEVHLLASALIFAEHASGPKREQYALTLKIAAMRYAQQIAKGDRAKRARAPKKRR